jgi:CHAT domain-containing protein
LPFAALLNPDGSVLIEHFRLRFLPSASVLKFLRPALAMKEAKLLVFGNPDLGDAALDLQFAESEAKEVASLYPDSRMMIRREASETNFKKAAGLFQRFHFATHGKFQAEAPLESRLFLARDGDNDGMLTAGELYTMNMDADLVTLSACETGLGKVANGDDVVGLTRGFLYAGSRSVVASLWSVDDQATAELMKTFYENLGGMSKDRALAEAQIKIRKMFPPPFFWAAFQLTGRAE